MTVTSVTAYTIAGPHTEIMNTTEAAYVYVRDLRLQAKTPENGILSQTLHGDERTKVILFGFAAGQELSAHTAPFPATLTFLKGDATLRLGAEEHNFRPPRAGVVYQRGHVRRHAMQPEALADQLALHRWVALVQRAHSAEGAIAYLGRGRGQQSLELDPADGFV